MGSFWIFPQGPSVGVFFGLGDLPRLVKLAQGRSETLLKVVQGNSAERTTLFALQRTLKSFQTSFLPASVGFACLERIPRGPSQ